MIAKEIFEDIAAKVSGVISDSPLKDVEKNAKTAVTAALSHLDLVTREEFETQQQIIEHLLTEVASLRSEVERLTQQA
ncbi:MAG: accessory factor UbiK family protein [Neisseriaceae bacterium]|nr:accessory factor UbiK family protein [Neisseriaceae bacterium]MBQ9182596.1 accessory factor UbiK family protein [Neisseriaceae bacterium]MBQ9724558.1 accessory factor UbiK family protein [Neisseriaceae bacterium]MBR1819408.1 accessory factor UbiK family protein [Neisseriaceae bacterium]MBR2251234.1 accessory factor UbiK family protein [Neisseriaceae bacterium]